jgi:hypothetical protein
MASASLVMASEPLVIASEAKQSIFSKPKTEKVSQELVF